MEKGLFPLIFTRVAYKKRKRNYSVQESDKRISPQKRTKQPCKCEGWHLDFLRDRIHNLNT